MDLRLPTWGKEPESPKAAVAAVEMGGMFVEPLEPKAEPAGRGQRNQPTLVEGADKYSLGAD